MAWHKDASTGDIHVIFDQTYATTTTRDADTDWNGDADNIGKVIKVTAGPVFFILEDNTPTWLEITTSVSQSLAGALAVGNITGGSDIDVQTGDMITIADDPVSGTDGANKDYVDAQVSAEDFWDRAGTVISPSNAGDDLSIDGKLGVGVVPNAYLMELRNTTALSTAYAVIANDATGVSNIAGFLVSTDVNAINIVANGTGTVANPDTIQIQAQGNTSGMEISTAGEMRFLTNTTIQQMVIDVDGNLGLGITGPVSIAHIYEDTTATGSTAGLTVEQDGTGDAVTHYILTGVQTFSTGIDQTDGNYKISASTDLGVDTALSVDPDGFLGIGRNPTTHLDVYNSNVADSAFVIIENDVATSSLNIAGLSARTDTARVGLTAQGTGANSDGFVFLTADANPGGFVIASDGDIFFKTDTAGEQRAIITDDGFIGLGDSFDPTYKVHVYNNDVTIPAMLFVENGVDGVENKAELQLTTGAVGVALTAHGTDHDLDKEVILEAVQNTNGLTFKTYGAMNFQTDATIVTPAVTVLELEEGIATVTGDILADNINVTENISFYDNSSQSQASTPSAFKFNIGTTAFLQELDINTEDTNPTDIYFKTCGLKMYVMGQQTASVLEYDLSTAWDVTTAIFLQSFATTSTNSTGLYLRYDGLKMYISAASTNEVFEYDLSVAWDISTAVFLQSLTVYSGGRGLFFKSDGSEMYLLVSVNPGDDIVYQYSLGEDWDISTAIESQTLDLAGETDIPRGVAITPDGTRLYVVDSNLSTSIYEYALSTPWGLSTGVYTGRSYDYSEQAAQCSGLYLKSDGSKFYITSNPADAVFEYDLGLAVGVINAGSLTSEDINGADLYNLGTGTLSGCDLSINAVDNTLLDVSAGVVLIADYSDINNIYLKKITVAAQTVAPTLSTSWNKWVGVQEVGTTGVGEIVFDSDFTQLEKRTIAIIGRVWNDGTDDIIDGVGQYTTPGFGQAKTTEDLVWAMGTINKFGNTYSSSGANLLLDKTAGQSFRFSAFRGESEVSPNTPLTEDGSQASIGAYYYIAQSSTSADIRSTIDPDQWDNAGSVESVPTGQYTLQRLYYYPSSQVLSVTYGQHLFNSMSEAISKAGHDDPTISTGLLEGAVLRGWIAVREGATDLSDSGEARFVTALSLSEPGAKQLLLPSSRSFSTSDPGTADDVYLAGFYSAPSASATLTIGGTVTQTLGTANVGYGAHAFVVASGAGGTDLVLTVTGTSIDNEGVETAADSEIVVADADAAITDQYFETTKTWSGTITYTLTGTAGAFTFNYGYAAYEDFDNSDFTVTGFVMDGLASTNASDTDITLIYHTSTNWTYSAGAFVPGSSDVICQWSADATERDFATSQYWKYKRTDLSVPVSGSTNEGLIILFHQTTNNSIRHSNARISVLK